MASLCGHQKITCTAIIARTQERTRAHTRSQSARKLLANYDFLKNPHEKGASKLGSFNNGWKTDANHLGVSKKMRKVSGSSNLLKIVEVS
jgi:hypothetical protein